MGVTPEARCYSQRGFSLIDAASPGTRPTARLEPQLFDVALTLFAAFAMKAATTSGLET
ncbi:hypothetical protein BraRD5C2_67600 [Bradyrhizobium sp. RD5-C2]|nr:hypothetical protein BraRD5C2_67600 [Bradyrhizobium sp. RD5-C2]